MIMIDRENEKYVISGNNTEIIAEIGATITTLIELMPREKRIDTATLIYRFITDEKSPLWKGTGVTVGEIKERLEDAEKRNGSLEDFLRRRFTRGEI